MARSSGISYAGALKVVSRDDARVGLIDRVMGGLIFAATPFTGGASLALVDPKNEFIALLRAITDTAAGRIKSSTGKTHLELLKAAHSLLGLSSFLEAFEAELGPGYQELEITPAEARRLAKKATDARRTFDTEVESGSFPMPSAMCGFAENLGRVREHVEVLFDLLVVFLEGLEAWPRVCSGDVPGLKVRTVARAEATYRDRFTRLAVDVPEFGLWITLDEHAATRRETRNELAEVQSSLQRQAETLASLHSLLTSPLRAIDGIGDIERRLALRAQRILRQPIWRTEIDGLSFPDVGIGFISPNFQTTEMAKDSRPEDEAWWSDLDERSDLAEFMAGYLADPESARRMLIVLGHPGAGKTLLTEVVAARIPAEAYTTILVKLRSVSAEGDPHRQIESAIEQAVHEQVSWGELCGASSKTKVVIFDGLDELIQATGTAQSGFLDRIADFQQKEWDFGRSVIPIVTSRLLVIDRVRVPVGAVLTKLNDFDDAQIDRWVETWNATNAASAGFRAITSAELLRNADLARQPLLLVLLSIYAASIDSADEEGLSEDELYRRLLDAFIKRQVIDKATVELSSDEQERRQAMLRRDLAIAAFAMFNRGQQFVTEEELSQDLKALAPRPPGRPDGFAEPLTRAKATVSAFFFVHVSHADEHDPIAARRSYEFLHATFGEYLVAEYAVDMLERLDEDRERLARRHDEGQLDDRIFRSLLAQQPLAKRLPAVDFARQMLRRRNASTLRETAIVLLGSARSKRSMEDVEGYAPTPFDSVGRLAAYTANLATFALIAKEEPVPVAALGGRDSWRSVVRLWESGLDTQGLHSVIRHVSLVEESVSFDDPGLVAIGVTDVDERIAIAVGSLGLAATIHMAPFLDPSEGMSLASMKLKFRYAELCASRWPTYVLDRMMPFDERSYQQLLAAAKADPGAISRDLAAEIVDKMVDDGPYLDPETVRGLLRETIGRGSGISSYSMPVLAYRFPFLVEDSWFREALRAADPGLFSAIIARVCVRRNPALMPALESLLNIGTEAEWKSFPLTFIAPEVLEVFEPYELSGEFLSAILEALSEFAELSFARMSPANVNRFLKGCTPSDSLIQGFLRPYLAYWSSTGVTEQNLDALQLLLPGSPDDQEPGV